MRQTLKVAIIAGEHSGDVLGANLIAELIRESQLPIEFIGIGGERMMSQGFKSSFEMSLLSVGGYGLDVIRSIPKILWVRHQIIKQIIEFKPDVFIGVDAPDFTFYIERVLRKRGIKTVHYISPTIWAWRYERIYSIKKSTDLMLCIFPMEEAIYHKEGIAAKFVGHPLANNIEFNIDTASYKQKLGLSGKVFTMLVGSRKSEIKSLAKIFIASCNIISQETPDAMFIFPLINQNIADLFNAELQSTVPNFKYQVLVGQTSDAIKASDMVIAKSGTVTLEVALCQKPLIITYKISKFTEWIVKRKIKINYVGQPNILLNQAAAPELLQDEANPKNIAKQFLDLYYDVSAQNVMINKFKQLHIDLSKENNHAGAKAILELIQC